MARHRAKISLLTAAILLAGCTTSRPPEVHKLHNEVGKLNQEVRQLTVQATALEMQNRLNTRASQGAWLLPTANTAVVLQSNVGELRLSLSNVEAEANGTRAILHIRSAGEQTLPALTAQIEWGELDASSGEPLSAASQSQTITLPSTLLPKAEANIPLRLSGIAPEQLGFVRVHDIMPASAQPAVKQQ